MIFFEQFWINKHSVIFEILQTTLSLKNLLVFIYSKIHENNHLITSATMVTIRKTAVTFYEKGTYVHFGFPQVGN